MGQTASQGGTAPSFDTTLTLAIDCFVERAKLEDVREDLDLLAWQVKEALLGDAGWVSLSAEHRVAAGSPRKFERQRG